MGNRANFVVVKDQGWQLYYSHWSGYRVLDALIGGPALALRYATSLRPSADNEWVSPRWADGGAVVDLDHRRLLFFGDELMLGMAERRAVLSVLGAVWPDYVIGWAYDGTAALARYVGIELPADRSGMQPTIRLARDRNSWCHVVSVVDATGRLRLWPLRHFNQAWHGPALLDKLPGRGAARLSWGQIPEGGVHVDVPKKTVGTWHTADTMGICTALPGLWSGWRTECWADRFEEHVLRCNGALRVPEVDLAAGIDEVQAGIQQRVFQSFADSPAVQIVALAKLLAPGRPGLVVSEDAITDQAARPTEAEWARFVDACDGLRVRRAEPA
ncbi:MAG TPA: hypothetical protein VFR27_18825 [Mycobacterium sp.]|nr:hypothetical protein [Mycobacterium sp.]